MSRTVRVLVVADEVAPQLYRPEVRELTPDLVVSCGDLPFEYLEYLVTTLSVPLVFVPGNHDPDLKVDRSTLAAQPLSWSSHMRDALEPGGCENIDGKITAVAGLRIAGLGGCIRYNEGPHQYTQRQMSRRVMRMEARNRMRPPQRRGVDLLVTHAPPLGTGDAADLPHQGIGALHRLIRVLEPTYLLHGHIHPYGFEQPDRRVGETRIINVIPYKLLEVEV